METTIQIIDEKMILSLSIALISVISICLSIYVSSNLDPKLSELFFGLSAYFTWVAMADLGLSRLALVYGMKRRKIQWTQIKKIVPFYGPLCTLASVLIITIALSYSLGLSTLNFVFLLCSGILFIMTNISKGYLDGLDKIELSIILRACFLISLGFCVISLQTKNIHSGIFVNIICSCAILYSCISIYAMRFYSEKLKDNNIIGVKSTGDIEDHSYAYLLAFTLISLIYLSADKILITSFYVEKVSAIYLFTADIATKISVLIMIFNQRLVNRIKDPQKLVRKLRYAQVLLWFVMIVSAYLGENIIRLFKGIDDFDVNILLIILCVTCYCASNLYFIIALKFNYLARFMRVIIVEFLVFMLIMGIVLLLAPEKFLFIFTTRALLNVWLTSRVIINESK